MAGLRKLRGRYYVRIFLPGGKEKLIPCRTGDKKEAEARKRQIEEKEFLVKARLVDDMGKTATRLSEATAEYLKDCRSRLRPKTYLTYDLALRNVRTCWDDLDLRQITASHISNLRQYLTARMRPNSVNINLRAARTFLNWLVDTEKIDRIPAKMSLVRVDQELPRFFVPGEIERILAAVKDSKLRATFRVLSGTGLRRNELFKCSLEGNYLHLRETKGRRERLVSIPPDLIPDFILATENPYHPDFISHAFTRAVKAAGISPDGRSLHSLRHTFALREYARTKDIFYVKGLLGHSSVTVTEIYMRFPEEYLQQVFGNQEPLARAIQDVQEAGRNTAFQA